MENEENEVFSGREVSKTCDTKVTEEVTDNSSLEEGSEMETTPAVSLTEANQAIESTATTTNDGLDVSTTWNRTDEEVGNSNTKNSVEEGSEMVTTPSATPAVSLTEANQAVESTATSTNGLDVPTTDAYLVVPETKACNQTTVSTSTTTLASNSATFTNDTTLAQAKLLSIEATVSTNVTKQNKRGKKRCNTKEVRNLCIRFEGNQSKRWDGKEALIEYDWLKEQVGATQLSPGNKVNIPWPTRGGEVQYWKGVVVNNDDASISDKKDGHNYVTKESSCVLSKRARGSR